MAEPASTEPVVLLDVDGPVATVTLNRPASRNAISGELLTRLGEAMIAVEDNDELRAVILTGADPAFCAGVDLKELGQQTSVLRGAASGGSGPWAPVSKPVIAAVNGAAAGAGLSLACACDLRIASDEATFVPAFINIGLIPDSGGTFFVTRLIGQSRALEWLGSGRRLSAEEALEWGLVSEVLEPTVLETRAAEVAGELAALPTRAIGMTKRLLDRAPTSTLDEQLEWEAQLQAAATQTDDFREGVDAFLEKRAPDFQGR